MTDQEKFTLDLLSVDEILAYIAENRVDGFIGCYGYRDKFDCPDIGDVMKVATGVNAASATFSNFPTPQAEHRTIVAMTLCLQDIISELQEDD